MRVLNVEPLRYGPDLRVLLGSVGQVDYVEVRNEVGLVGALKRAPYDALFTRLGLLIGPRTIAACPRLRCVVSPTTGLEHIDTEALCAAGIQLISLKGATEFLRGVRSTAEHTWALLLALVRRLPAAQADVLEGAWRREPFLASELHGKCLGLVGVGRIGGMVAAYGTAFRMRVIGFDLQASAFSAAEAAVSAEGIETVLGTADVVSLHLPLDEATRGFLSVDRVQTMKHGAFLINTARGELLDEHAVLNALETGRLAGAALDVLCGDGVWEGLSPIDHPLVRYARGANNLILTPHCAGFGRESVAATRRFVIERFLDAHGVSSSGRAVSGLESGGEG